MGTNYYLLNPPPKYQLEGARDLHIGKSSMGWAFSLHVDPVIGLDGWEEWEEVLERKKSKIVDEYERPVAFMELRDYILNRPAQPKLTDKAFQPPRGDNASKLMMWSIVWGSYKNADDFLRKNHAWQDHNGLLRHEVDGRHCIWNSVAYTFDAVTGVFC